MRNQKVSARRSTRRPTHGGAAPAPPRRTRRSVRPAEVRHVRQHVLLGLYALLALECGAALLTSPWLDVERIAVTGTSTLSATEADVVAARAAGLARTNWLRAPVGSVERSLRQLPWVASAWVTRRFPDSVHIAIRPREPFLTAQVGPSRYEIDSAGVPI